MNNESKKCNKTNDNIKLKEEVPKVLLGIIRKPSQQSFKTRKGKFPIKSMRGSICSKPKSANSSKGRPPSKSTNKKTSNSIENNIKNKEQIQKPLQPQNIKIPLKALDITLEYICL